MAAVTRGLDSAEAARRLQADGPNELMSHAVGPFGVLESQLKNPLLLLLAGTATLSLVLRDATDAAIILAISALSVGLGFFNEYRAQRALADLHKRTHQTARVMRDGKRVTIDVAQLVAGDVVVLAVGDIVPADVQLLVVHDLACDEAIITGESLPAEKTVDSRALMGSIVRGGNGVGVIVATGRATQMGTIATNLGRQWPETTFQRGLRDFSGLLVWVTTVLTILVFVALVIARHAIVEPLLFALAIAVSMTPQLLPAIVTVSLATGARRMAARSVLVKRLVAIEDLGNMTVLFTDKTGTLTEGTLTLTDALDAAGHHSDATLRLAAICAGAFATDGDAGGNVTGALDDALLAAPMTRALGLGATPALGQLPFDYDRRLRSVLVDDGDRRTIVTIGAPESVLAVCPNHAATFEAVLTAQFADGARVVAVASRVVPGLATLGKADECDFTLCGLLTFRDPPKADAGASIARLERLGIAVKIITGDNELVAQKVCRDLEMMVGATLNGTQMAAMDDATLSAALATTTIFARVAPEQKARLIRLQRATGRAVGFLGDGVNDAIALHDADVGISVESAADVAKDAADIVLVTQDLGILADGVTEGRRIFSNTIKYVLMATSSNFGNTLSTAIGSLLLPFLPLLPSQILMGNLLYDVSEMTITTDNVDDERLRRPAHWDMRFIKRFMIVFGPISSLGDLSIFAVMLAVFHAGPTLFRSGYFVESFVTQTLIVFAIRTARVPFFKSRPSAALAATTLAVSLIGAGIPFTPLARFFGFMPLPLSYFAYLVPIALVYIVVVETAKFWFYRKTTVTSS